MKRSAHLLWMFPALLLGAWGVHALTPPVPVVVQDWTADAARAFAAQRVEQATLDNGLKVMVLPTRGAPWCGLATVVAGGASTDPPGQSGVAHLAEHLFFEEGGGLTPSRGDVDGEALGMRSNAFTLGDYTVIVEEFSPAVLEQALAIHARRLLSLTFHDAQLEREKTVVADERRFRVEEPPLAQAQETLVAKLWGDQHPFGRPVLGWPADVKALTAPQVRAWVDAYMRPNRAALAVVGPVDAAATLVLLRKMLSPWAGRGPAGPIPSAMPVPMHSSVTHQHATFGGALVALPVDPLGSPQEAVDRVIARLLTLDPAVVLPGALPDWPQDARLEVEHVLQVHHGEFQCTIQAAPQDATQPALLVQGYLRALGQAGPRPVVLDGVTAQLVADLHRGLGSHAGRAEQLAVDAALLGRPLATAERMRALRSVTPQQVQERAAVLARAATASVVVDGDEDVIPEAQP